MKLQTLLESNQLNDDEKDAIGDIIDGTLDSINDFEHGNEKDRAELMTFWVNILRKLDQADAADDWEREI